jgi:pimeloyl-ACP methyl ester carboxylesterase
VYRPAVAPLFAAHRVVSLPPRALWPDAGSPPGEPGSWTSLADDLLSGMREHRLPPLVAIGHSFGAVAALLAAVREPARFRALVLLDPTILPPEMMDGIAIRQQQGDRDFRPLIEGARKRRAHFGSASEAFAYWRGKPLFADWVDAALHRYVEATLVPDPSGGFRLAWPPAWEAWYYESFYAGSWGDVARLDPKLPVLVIGGERSDTFVPEARALLPGKLPLATHRTLAGAGHLFPMAAPEETGRLIAGWLAA